MLKSNIEVGQSVIGFIHSFILSLHCGLTSTSKGIMKQISHMRKLEKQNTHLGCRIDAHGGSEEEVRRRIDVTRGCMKSLTKNIWRSSILPRVKIQLYNTYVLPVLVYGSEKWDITVRSSKQLDAFDQ